MGGAGGRPVREAPTPERLYRSLEEKHFFSLTDVAELCGVTPAAVFYWREDGIIKEYERTSKRGKHLIPRHEVIRLLKERDVEAPGLWVRQPSVKKLLVIDDYKPILNLVKEIVRQKKLPFEVVTADNVEDGLVLASQEKPDLILLDYSFPERAFQASDALAFIRKASVLRNIKVIGMSGDHSAGVGMIRSGAVDFLRKPFDYIALKGALLKHAGVSKG